MSEERWFVGLVVGGRGTWGLSRKSQHEVAMRSQQAPNRAGFLAERSSRLCQWLPSTEREGTKTEMSVREASTIWLDWWHMMPQVRAVSGGSENHRRGVSVAVLRTQPSLMPRCSPESYFATQPEQPTLQGDLHGVSHPIDRQIGNRRKAYPRR